MLTPPSQRYQLVGLLCGVAAVDGEGDAGDESGAGAGEPQHGSGDLFGGAEPVDGLVGFGDVEVEFAFVDHVGDHRGGDGAGADGVDPDSAGGVLEGGALGEADDAVLGGVVRRPAGQTDEPAEGGVVDDRPAALG